MWEAPPCGDCSSLSVLWAFLGMPSAGSLCLAILAVSTSLLRAAAPADRLSIPPELEGAVVLYHGFERGTTSPEVAPEGSRVVGVEATAAGLFGRGYAYVPSDVGRGNGLEIRSLGIGPDRPVTAMVWWRLDAPMQDHSCFHILALTGKGHIASFVRGKGDWCALPEPRRIFQVHGFPGIANVHHHWSERVWPPAGRCLCRLPPVRLSVK